MHSFISYTFRIKKLFFSRYILTFKINDALLFFLSDDFISQIAWWSVKL